jgi:hypothetical protein
VISLKLCRNTLIRLFVAMVIISSLMVPPGFCLETEDSQIFMSGFNAYQQKNYLNAIKKMNEVLQKYPDSPLRDMAIFWLARSYFKSGDMQDAARYMSQFSKEYPDNPLRGTVEDELLSLTARYEKGEKLPSGAGQAEEVAKAPVAKKPAEKEQPAISKAELERIAAEKAEQERQAQLKATQEKQAAEKAAKEQLAKQQAEQEQLARSKAEQERLSSERAEKERLAQLKAEQEKRAAEQAVRDQLAKQQAAEQAVKDQLAKQQAEKEQQAKTQAEQERIAAEKTVPQQQAQLATEQAKQTAEQAAKEQLAKQQAAEQAAKEQLAKQQAEKEQQAKAQAEQQRIAAEKAEQVRLAQLKAEQEKQAAKEQAIKEQLAKQQATKEQQAKAQAEQQRLAAEKAEQERLTRLKVEQEKQAAEQAEKLRLAREKAEQKRLETEKAAQEQAASERAEQERLAQLKIDQEKQAADQAERMRVAREKAEQQRKEAAKSEQERLAQMKAAQEQSAAEQARMERLAKAKAEQERVAAEKGEQERLAQLKAAEEKAAAKKVEAERVAAQKVILREKAIAQYKSIIENYPNSNAAATAAAKLKDLGIAVALPPQVAAIERQENAQVLKFEVTQYAGFEFNLMAQPKSYEVARRITIPFEITNRGNGADTFQLDSSFPAEFKAAFATADAPEKSIRQTPKLAPGEIFKGIVSLEIPASSIDGLKIAYPVKVASNFMAEATQSREVAMTASAPLLRAVLKMDRTHLLPGEKALYRIAVLNIGSMTAKDVSFRLNFPPQLEPLDLATSGLKKEAAATNPVTGAAPVLVADGLQIKSGETREFSVNFQLKDDSLAGQQMFARVDLDNSQLKTRASFISNAALVDPQHGIKVRTASERRDVIPGQTITVPIVVTNTGNVNEKFKIASSMKTGQVAMFFLDINRDGIRQNEEPVITELGPLAPKEEASIVMEIKTPRNVSDRTEDSALVTFTPEGDATRTASVSANLIYSRPELKMAISSRDGRLKPGEVTSFDLTLTNNGSNIARVVELQSAWPEQLELVSADPANSSNTNGTILWRFKEVGAGEKKTIKVAFRAKYGTSVGTNIQVRNILTYEDQLGNRY